MDLANSADTASSSERPSNQYASTSPKPAESQNDIPDIQQQLLSEAAEPRSSTSPKTGHHAANEAQDEDAESGTKDEDSSDSETEPDSDAADCTFQPEEDSESEGQDDSPDKKRKSKPKGKSTAGGSIAKTAKEKVRKNLLLREKEFKRHIRNELALKRQFGEIDVDIEPPRAKRPRIHFKRHKKTSTGTGDMEFDEHDKSEGLPEPDHRQITQKERDQDLKGREFRKHVQAVKETEILTWQNARFKKHGGDFTTLTRYKVVLTTIAELRQYPSDDELQQLDQKHGRSSKEYREALADASGAIFGVKWYRIILDEGHAVKNQNTLSFKSCYGLQKKTFFGLTATPLVNQEREMFPYIKLLGVEGIHTLSDLKNKFFKPHDTQTKLDALIHLITYRRTKKDEFLGRPMMACLPNFEAQEIWVKLSKQERLIYDMITEHFALVVPPNRLRAMQCQRMLVSHAWNLERALTTDGSAEFLTSMRDQLRSLDGHGHLTADGNASPRLPQAIVKTDEKVNVLANKQDSGASESQGAKSKTKMMKRKATRKTLQKTTRKSTKRRSSRNFHPKATDTHLGMRSLLRYAINQHIVDHACCGKCGKKEIVKPWFIVNCNHLFCHECLSDTWRSSSNGICPSCKVTYDKQDGAEPLHTLTTREAEYIEADKLTAVDEAEAAPPAAPPKKKGRRAPKKPKKQKKLTEDQKKKIEKDFNKKKYGVDANGVFMDLKREDSTFIRIATHEAKGVIQHSSKTACVMDIITEWQKEAPDDKVIVFHEFSKTGKILGMALNQVSVPFVYLNGEISESARPKAIDRFKNDPTIKVLLSSRVGKEGLNLTCANRLIIIDNWWNNAAELQAFGRIDRNGQKKRTYAVVIKAADTIDEYIEDLQESKAEKVAHRLQDDKHETKLMSEWEIMLHTAPEAYKAKCAQLIKEIDDEEASEDEEEDAAEGA
ncbi:DNA repair protein RAD5 [Colletotrichum sp. SAR 10_77]|nr:DNA repair protein RAD5 [Colletotrichum sp. SAR 10_75]KAI8250252.1 DNA repair protein RAD5 [Colletotrichum sp. SAR 10_77]KAJ4998834.1 DNA repair protein RAD5 [Colletotrichum sp. SAR 10_66]